MTKTGHVGINVTDLDRSIRFYSQVLLLDPMGGSREDGKRFAFLGDGTDIVLTIWEQSAGRFDRGTPGLPAPVAGAPSCGFF